MAHQGFGIELEGFYRGHGVCRCASEVGTHPKTVNKLTPKWFGPEPVKREHEMIRSWTRIM